MYISLCRVNTKQIPVFHTKRVFRVNTAMSGMSGRKSAKLGNEVYTRIKLKQDQASAYAQLNTNFYSF